MNKALSIIEEVNTKQDRRVSVQKEKEFERKQYFLQRQIDRAEKKKKKKEKVERLVLQLEETKKKADRLKAPLKKATPRRVRFEGAEAATKGKTLGRKKSRK